jgi:hypothetical protein
MTWRDCGWGPLIIDNRSDDGTTHWDDLLSLRRQDPLPLSSDIRSCPLSDIGELTLHVGAEGATKQAADPRAGLRFRQKRRSRTLCAVSPLHIRALLLDCQRPGSSRLLCSSREPPIL